MDKYNQRNNFCISCGLKREKEYKFCTQCGINFESKSDMKQEIKQRVKTPFILALVGIGLIIFFINPTESSSMLTEDARKILAESTTLDDKQKRRAGINPNTGELVKVEDKGLSGFLKFVKDDVSSISSESKDLGGFTPAGQFVRKAFLSTIGSKGFFGLIKRTTDSTINTYKKEKIVYVKYRDKGPVDLNHTKFEYQDTSKSAFVDGVWYDNSEDYMVIKLRDTYYHYCDIPSSLWSSFQQANSFGSFYNSKIKGNYSCRDQEVPSY